MKALQKALSMEKVPARGTDFALCWCLLHGLQCPLPVPSASALCQCHQHKAMQQVTATLVMHFTTPEAGFGQGPAYSCCNSSACKGVQRVHKRWQLGNTSYDHADMCDV